MEVIVAVDAQNLKDEKSFTEHLKDEGLERVEEEDGLVFAGVSSTPVMHTRAFIMEVVSKALQKSPADFCNIVCMIGENPLESYKFDKKTNDFLEIR
ncbi:MAG: hypothetical protein GX780_05935 [Campylobacteraceae bacterium]|nr:hypothetical protein [Campylobacteraceae bacterium]